MCEQLGKEPDPAKMPLETSAFPPEVQVAFFIFSMLPDHWDTNSGTYLGKNWDSLNTVLDIYEVDDRKIIFYFMKLYESEIVEFRAKEAERKRKAEERKRNAAGGGQEYAHRVKG